MAGAADFKGDVVDKGTNSLEGESGETAQKSGQVQKGDGSLEKLKEVAGVPAPSKQALFDEAKYVFDILDKLDFKASTIPDVIYLISAAWFDKWKKRVNYAKFEEFKKGTGGRETNKQGTGSI